MGNYLFVGVKGVPRLSAVILFSFALSIFPIRQKPGWRTRAITPSGAQIHKVKQADFAWGRFWGIFLSLCFPRGGFVLSFFGFFFPWSGIFFFFFCTSQNGKKNLPFWCDVAQIRL